MGEREEGGNLKYQEKNPSAQPCGQVSHTKFPETRSEPWSSFSLKWWQVSFLTTMYTTGRSFTYFRQRWSFKIHYVYFNIFSTKRWNKVQTVYHHCFLTKHMTSKNTHKRSLIKHHWLVCTDKETTMIGRWSFWSKTISRWLHRPLAWIKSNSPWPYRFHASQHRSKPGVESTKSRLMNARSVKPVS